MSKMPENIDVVILCGGFGKRLKNILRGNPKPMAKIRGRYFLDIIIDYMSGLGFKRFILCTGYRHGVIKKHYIRRSDKDEEILFSREKKPLETGGALKNAKSLVISDPFIVMNGDSFSRFNASDFLKFHKRKKALVSIAAAKEEDAKDCGEIKSDRFSRIIYFLEKNINARKCFVNAGIYICSKKLFELMPRKRRFSLEREFFPALIGKNIYAYKGIRFFIDIGTPQRYKKAKRIFWHK